VGEKGIGKSRLAAEFAAEAHARGATVLTALASALAVLARPEAVVLVPLFFLAERPAFKRAAIFAGVTALVLAPSVVFSLLTVGAPFPATAAAKVEGGLLGWVAGVHESALRTFLLRPWDFVTDWIAWLSRTHWLLLLAVPALALVGRRGARRLALPAIALVLHPLAMALLAPYREPSFQEGRYSMHLLPVAFVLLAVAAPRGERVRRPITLLWLVLALLPLPRAADRYAWGVQNINAMQVHLGRWVDRELPKTARLAVNDIGAIAYFSRREVIDLIGLVTPEILPYKRRGDSGVIEYVRETCPDYLIVFPSWFPELTKLDWLVEPVYRVRLERNVVSGGDEMVVYRLRRCAV
jgi:hypothetical protein